MFFRFLLLAVSQFAFGLVVSNPAPLTQSPGRAFEAVANEEGKLVLSWLDREGVQVFIQEREGGEQQVKVGDYHPWHAKLAPPVLDKGENLFICWHTLDEEGNELFRAAYQPIHGPWKFFPHLKQFVRGVMCERLHIEADQEGNFLLIWGEDDNRNSSIHLALYSPEEERFLFEKEISSPGQDSWNPHICWMGSGGGMIVWHIKGGVQSVHFLLHPCAKPGFSL